MRRTLTVLLVLASVLIAPALTTVAHAQIKATGTVQGRVTDADGVALPGVQVTVTGEMARGEQIAFTGADGGYRIPLLLPGEYVLTFRLQGFATIIREDVEVGVQRNTTVNADMRLTSFEETITVTGRSPIVDIKSTKRSSEYSDALRNVLPETRGVGADLMNLAPEATPGGSSTNASGANFFGDTGFSVAALVDGVNVSDPGTGGMWPFYSPDWFEVVELTSIGASADLGKFQGVAFNVVTKSGGNTYHGETNYYYKNSAFIGDNTVGINEEQCPEDYAAGEPCFEPPSLDYGHDFTFGVGGPLKRDKLWFFASYQAFYEDAGRGGASFSMSEDSDRFFGKVTWQVNQDNRLTTSLMADSYTLDGRPLYSPLYMEWESTAFDPSFNFTPNITWNSVLNPNTFLEIKYSGFYGFYDVVPRWDVPGTWDGGDWFYYGGFKLHLTENRSRSNIQGSLSHYVEDWAGDHSFKFGAEWERAMMDGSLEYNANVNAVKVMGETFEPGTLGIYYYAYYGDPYYAYIYQPNRERATSVQSPLTVYVQDDWTVADRLTLNLGLRFDRWVMGYLDGVTIPDSPVFNDLSPRLGANFDVFGDGTTSLNAFYGRFYEAAHGFAFYDFDPRRATWYGLYWDGSQYDAYDSVDPLADIGLDPDLRNQYSNQFVVGLDRQITENLSFTGRYIHKKTRDIYAGQDIRTQYVPVQAQTSFGDSITVYNAPDGLDRFRLLRNNPWEELFGPSFREYNGVQFKAVRRLADGWSLIASLLIQKSAGNNTAYTGSLSARDSPNDFVGYPGWLNDSRRYVSKIQGSYRIPAPVDTQLGFIINWMSGGRETPTERIQYYQIDGEDVRLGQRSITVPIAQRGSYVKDTQFRLDLRVDKRFQIGGGWGDIGVILDVFNIFNDDSVVRIEDRVDSRLGFGYPEMIVIPRTLRLGVRWMF